MRYQVELSQVKWKKCMQMQMAMHCAPVLAGIKPSNAVTLDYIDSKELIQSLAGSEIKCGLIYSGNGKCLWLLYREQQVKISFIHLRIVTGFTKQVRRNFHMSLA